MTTRAGDMCGLYCRVSEAVFLEKNKRIYCNIIEVILLHTQVNDRICTFSAACFEKLSFAV